MPRVDLTGKKFGRLTVISPNYTDIKRSRWNCICDCGNKTVSRTESLINGKSKSCGCLRKEKIVTHGETKTRLYNIWHDMRSRCKLPSNGSYKNYGAKGIKVCQEWNTYENFREWALTHGYDENLTIDRIDSTLDYSPENCRWATYTEQNINKKNSISFGGLSLKELCDKHKIQYRIVYWRIHHGWTIEKALSTPKRNKCK